MSRSFKVFGERDERIDVADGQIVRVKHKMARTVAGGYVEVTDLTFSDGAAETVWGTHPLENEGTGKRAEVEP